jgi:hypothetical protein
VYDLAERALPVHLECTCSTLTVTFACADWRVVTVIHKWAETRPESGPAAFPSRSLDVNNRNARCRTASPFTRASPPGSHVPRTHARKRLLFRAWAADRFRLRRSPEDSYPRVLPRKDICCTMNGRFISLYNGTPAPGMTSR